MEKTGRQGCPCVADGAVRQSDTENRGRDTDRRGRDSEKKRQTLKMIKADGRESVT